MKGLLQSLEAMIAILMVLTVFILFYSPKEEVPEFETIGWRLRGISSLKVLDENGELRKYVLANDTLTIKNKLSELLFPELNYEIIICEVNCSKPSIEAEKLTSVNYFISGEINEFKPRQIVLYMWLS